MMDRLHPTLSLGGSLPQALSRFAPLLAATTVIAPAMHSASAWAVPALSCGQGLATSTRVGRPNAQLAWRAVLLSDSPVHARPVRAGRRQGSSAGSAAHFPPRLRQLTPATSSSVLVLGAWSARHGGCWLRVRLPWKPNAAAGWIEARHVSLRPTRWRIVVSRRERTVTVLRRGRVSYRTAVVIGKPATPTPRGLFSIVAIWRTSPTSFEGSYILALSAHSDVLPHFEGGDGQVAIHGRGGASLSDPLGSARSHGCVRLANVSIEAIVRRIGQAQLPGTPVLIE